MDRCPLRQVLLNIYVLTHVHSLGCARNIYIHLCTHACKHTSLCTCTSIYIYVLTHVHALVCAHVYLYTSMYSRTYTSLCICTSMYWHTYMLVCAYVHLYIFMYARTHARTHACKHTHCTQVYLYTSMYSRTYTSLCIINFMCNRCLLVSVHCRERSLCCLHVLYWAQLQ